MFEHQYCEGELRQYTSHAPPASCRVANMEMGARVMKCAIFVLCMLVTNHPIPICNVLVRKELQGTPHVSANPLPQAPAGADAQSVSIAPSRTGWDSTRIGHYLCRTN